VISYLLTVPSPTMISASPVMTLVVNISTFMGPTGTGCRLLLLSVPLIVLLKKRLNTVLISAQASESDSDRYTFQVDNAERDVWSFILVFFVR
jgi:hypothetical protein